MCIRDRPNQDMIVRPVLLGFLLMQSCAEPRPKPSSTPAESESGDAPARADRARSAADTQAPLAAPPATGPRATSARDAAPPPLSSPNPRATAQPVDPAASE